MGAVTWDLETPAVTHYSVPGHEPVCGVRRIEGTRGWVFMVTGLRERVTCPGCWAAVGKPGEQLEMGPNAKKGDS